MDVYAEEMEYSLNEKGHVLDSEGKDLGTIEDFLEDEYDLTSDISDDLLFYNTSVTEKKKMQNKVSQWVSNYFKNIFKDSVSEDKLWKEIKKVKSKFSNLVVDVISDAKNKIDSSLENTNKISNIEHKTGGVNMFKNLKEAKMFTAHLDALASEIENLPEVSDEMRKHLAFRLDKLSDLIEKTATHKEANGIGQGAHEHDSDESYMKTMGGTGVLEGEKDETHYMKEFNGDDHREVLQRKEPSEVKKASEVSLEEYVQKAMAKLK
jgi:hypothetical protein